MALPIGLYTSQVSLMLERGNTIMILIVGTIFLLIPCVIYWLRYLNRLLAQDEGFEGNDKSESDVVSSADVQGIQMVDRNLDANPDSHVVEVHNYGPNNNNNDNDNDNDYDNIDINDPESPSYLGNDNPQYIGEEPRSVRVNKVSPPSTSHEQQMPRRSVTGDLLPPPLDYEKDDHFSTFMIGLPRYLEGTAVERDLKHSIESMTKP